jgi:two-component system nitrate/nitrite sensor histidine kinase NarX
MAQSHTDPVAPETDRCPWWVVRPARRAHALGALPGNELTRPLFLLAVILVVAAVAGLAALTLGRAHVAVLATLQIVLLGLGLAIVVCLKRRLNRHLLEPLADLRSWALQMRSGNLAARVPVPRPGELAALATDVNSLAGQLQVLTQDMNAQVRAQTARISRKTRSLEILYEVVASLSTARNRDELLDYFLEAIMELLDARAATVALLDDADALQPAAAEGRMDEIIKGWNLQPTYDKLCNAVAREGKIKIYGVPRPAGAPRSEKNLVETSPELIVVPIQYRGRILGVFTLFLTLSSTELGDDFRDLLTSVGRHAGLALEKTRLDENARRLAVMEERDILRDELHDSLAQSLISMRLQVKMLGETLHKKDIRTAQNEVRQLALGIEAANTSLRELLASFRSKMDDRGLIPALEDLVERFQQDTGVTTFFQHDCRELSLSPNQEVEVFRIVQEGLANIRRHSGAQTARVFMSDDGDGAYRLLVEDDGVGILESYEGGEMDQQHFGLAIMRERSQRLGGELVIESEAGEGTRVSLSFPARRAARSNTG